MVTNINRLVTIPAVSIGAKPRWAAGVWMNPVRHCFPLGMLVFSGAAGVMIGLALRAFSALSRKFLHLLQRGHIAMAVLHAAAHVFGSLACVAASFNLARRILRA